MLIREWNSKEIQHKEKGKALVVVCILPAKMSLSGSRQSDDLTGYLAPTCLAAKLSLNIPEGCMSFLHIHSFYPLWKESWLKLCLAPVLVKKTSYSTSSSLSKFISQWGRETVCIPTVKTHPIWQCLGASLGSSSNSSFLLLHTGEEASR